MKKAIIYTDGSCDNKTGIGGWGAIINVKGIGIEMSGAAKDTTSNRMEVTAAIKALNSIKKGCHIIVRTDSMYLKDGATDWIYNWEAKGFSGVKNADLWRIIYKLSRRHWITWEHVKGHSGIEGNERADALAGKQFKKLRNKMKNVRK